MSALIFQGSALIVYGRDKYYGIFSGAKYARLIAKKRNREIARELEKMLAEKLSKKKITEFIRRLRKE